MIQTSEANALSRRKFLKTSGFTGAALFLGFYLPASAKAGTIISETALKNVEFEIEMNAWILIDTSGKVTLVDHRAEMGQGSFQSVPQIISEELEVELNNINVIFAQGNQKKFGSQITGGSSTIRGSYINLLTLGASARVLLIQVAAAKWNVPVSECYAKNGHVFHKADRQKFSLRGTGGGCIQTGSAKECETETPIRIHINRQTPASSRYSLKNQWQRHLRTG